MSESENNRLLLQLLVPLFFATIIVSGRVYARAFIIKHFGWDDFLITISWWLYLTLVVLFSIAMQYGKGQHKNDIDRASMAISSQLGFGTLLSYQLCLCCTELSVYMTRAMRLAIWITIGWVAVYGLVLCIGTIFICNPAPEASFGLNLVTNCLPLTPFMISSAVLHPVTDTWLIIMVAPSIIPMTLPLKQKIVLVFVMGLGVFDITVAVWRAAIIFTYDGEDFTFSLQYYATWQAVQCGVGLMCASIPMLRPLLRNVPFRRRGSGDSDRTKSSQCLSSWQSRDDSQKHIIRMHLNIPVDELDVVNPNSRHQTLAMRQPSNNREEDLVTMRN